MKDYDKKLYENVEDLMIYKAVASIHKVVFFLVELRWIELCDWK